MNNFVDCAATYNFKEWFIFIMLMLITIQLIKLRKQIKEVKEQ